MELSLLEKRAESDSNIINVEIVAIIDKLLEYKGINPTDNQKTIEKFNVI